MSGRFPKQEHLRNSRDFRRISKSGRRISTTHFTVLASRSGDVQAKAWSRLGLAVSRRVGNAVTRNRVKRHIREWFCENREALQDPVDLVVIARQGAGSLVFSEVCLELSEAARLVRKHSKECGNE